MKFWRALGAITLLCAALLGSHGDARAQGCGSSNPNCIVPTAPAGTSDNRAASTAFVGVEVPFILPGLLASPPSIGGTAPNTGEFTSLLVTGLSSSGTSCLQASASGQITLLGSPCGTGSGAVNSVANSDGTLTISPTAGNVVASLALGHANTWTATQTFNAASSIVAGGTITGPTLIGGTAAGSTLTLESTSGAGTSDFLSAKTGAGLERLRITSGGQINVNPSASSSPGAWLEIDTIDNFFNPAITIQQWSNDAVTNILAFVKSRGTTIGTNALLSNNDQVSAIVSRGSKSSSATSNMAEIDVYVDGVTTSGQNLPGRMTFATSPNNGPDTERLRIDSNGTVNIGNQGAAFPTVFGDIPSLQISSIQQGLDLRRYLNGVFGPYIGFAKSRGTSIGTNTTVQNGDALGQLYFSGYDATGTPVLQAGAVISAFVDAAPTVGAVPARLVFGAGAGFPERMRIDSNGSVNVGNNGPIIATIFSSAPVFQVSDASGQANAAFHLYANNANAPFITFVKSRGSTVGSNVAPNNFDQLGYLSFGAFNTSLSLQESANIYAQVNGTTGASGAPPGALHFGTAPGGGSTADRLVIDSAGKVNVVSSNSNNPVSVGTGQLVLQIGSGNFPGIGLSDTGAIGLFSSGLGTQLNVGFGANTSSAASIIATFSNSTATNGVALNIAPPGSSIALGTIITQTAHGTPNAANYFGASGTGYALNNILINSDDMALSQFTPSIGIGYGWAINHDVGGANMTGARSAIGVALNLLTASSPSNYDKEYVGATIYATATVNDGGTNTGAGAAGAVFAMNPFACLCSTSATNFNGLSGAEVDISNRGGSVEYKFGWRIVLDGGDNGQGAAIDAAYSVGGGGLHGGWKAAYLLDDLGANSSPVGTNGCILCTSFTGGPYSIATGIDISAYNITGVSFKAGNFQVNGGTGDTALRHLIGTGATPTASSCPGFSLATGSTDLAGAVTFTSGTTCTIAFGHAFANNPFCVANANSGNTAVTVGVSTAGLQVTFGTAESSFSYACFGQ